MRRHGMGIPRRAYVITAALTAGILSAAAATSALASPGSPTDSHGNGGGRRRTPIKHLVVIFDENISFDHYFGTYPYAANTDGTTFTAKKNTPKVNGLYTKITKSGPTGPVL